ncbi:hypothetical protein DTW90_31450 [Neorhizobium sp. P12A]|nr:hypothetical protein DTW90_31450 [Neorhizobium sp. P12A]
MVNDNGRGRGRPRLDLEAVLVRLPEGTCTRIDALVGKNRRSQFVRELIEAELARREGDEPQKRG